MAVGNAINEQTTGVCGFTGTAFTGSPATQHCVQIGGASSDLLVSVTNGTTGQVLTATTASAPTWQTPASPPFNPNEVITIVDDFIGGNGNTVTSATYNYEWSLPGVSFLDRTTTESGHPGIMGNNSYASGAAILALSNMGNSRYNFILGGGELTLNWVFNITALSTGSITYTLRIGMGDTVGTADQVNGVYVEYTNAVNSGNWQFKTANASTRTTSNSSVAVTTGWHNLAITINAAASSVSYTMDGVSLGTAITTNIPTAASITPLISASRSAGTVAVDTFLVDLFYLTQTLTTPR